MGEKKVVDLSRYFLFESAGDSEADLGANLASFGIVNDVYKGRGDDDDNGDAESSSCDTCFRDVDVVDKDGDGYDDHSYHGDHTYYDDHHSDEVHHCNLVDDNEDDEIKEVEEEEEEKASSEVTSTANSYALRKCSRSSKRIKMSEVEKSRLFWEACLAS